MLEKNAQNPTSKRQIPTRRRLVWKVSGTEKKIWTGTLSRQLKLRPNDDITLAGLSTMFLFQYIKLSEALEFHKKWPRTKDVRCFYQFWQLANKLKQYSNGFDSFLFLFESKWTKFRCIGDQKTTERLWWNFRVASMLGGNCYVGIESTGPYDLKG